MDAFQLILFPIIFIALMGIVFGASILTSAIDTNVGIITCRFPDYANGISQATYPCSAVNKPDTYTDDSFLGVPIGWYNYGADTLTSIGARALSLFILILLVAFPIASIALLVPNALSSLMFGILAPFTAILYIMLGLGAYKALSPFVGK